MTIKAVEIVRKIRDLHYSETRNMNAEEQIRYYRKKAESLRKVHTKEHARSSNKP